MPNHNPGKDDLTEYTWRWQNVTSLLEAFLYAANPVRIVLKIQVLLFRKADYFNK